MKYLSLFSGIGGFELGIQQAYESNTKHALISEESESQERSQGRIGSTNLDRILLHTGDRTAPLCIGYSEIDKYATQIYQKHFSEHHNYGDITKIKAEELPDFDFLCGGFPCQSFSIAGLRKGFEDTRGTLFFDIARILKEKRPRRFLLENVKGLLSHDSGKTFYTIISTLDELGYDIQWQVLNSKNFGVPQNRERVFIVGHLRGTPRPQVFPITGSNSKNLEQIVGGGQGNRLYSTDGISTTIASQAGGQGAKTGLYAFSSSQRKDHIDYRIKKGEANTLTTGIGCAGGMKSMSFVKEDTKIRRLTPKEAERLQGFPDGWTEGVSDTQRYKCLGNAVTVNVIQAIMEKLL